MQISPKSFKWEKKCSITGSHSVSPPVLHWAGGTALDFPAVLVLISPGEHSRLGGKTEGIYKVPATGRRSTWGTFPAPKDMAETSCLCSDQIPLKSKENWMHRGMKQLAPTKSVLHTSWVSFLPTSFLREKEEFTMCLGSSLKLFDTAQMSHLPARTATNTACRLHPAHATPETQTQEPCRNAKHQRNFCHEPPQHIWRNPGESSQVTFLLMSLLTGSRSSVAFHHRDWYAVITRLVFSWEPPQKMVLLNGKGATELPKSRAGQPPEKA